MSRFKLINSVAGLLPKGKHITRPQAIFRHSKTVVVILKVHNLFNIKLEVVKATMAVEGKYNILADIEVDKGFAECKYSVGVKTGCSLTVEAENMAATDRIFVNNGHLQSSLSSLRNEDDLFVVLN